MASNIGRMKVRDPAVAGGFYPFSKGEVVEKLRELFGHWDIDYSTLMARERTDSLGVVVPHAGYVYSGYVAARVFADIPRAGTVFILGPNHTGMGPDFSVSSDDAWRTPLGTVEVDTDMVGRVAEESDCELDEMAHLREHSIEVQLPFLQSVLDDFRIVPIAIKHYAPDGRFLAACRSLGASLAGIADGDGVLFVASTDFTHYEPEDVAEAKDAIAMSRIGEMDEGGLFSAISEKGISMCGYAGVAASLAACRALGARKAKKVAYMTSSYASGDRSAVVGYGGMRIY